MSELNPPPLPGKKAMIAMAVALLALVSLVVFLVVAIVMQQTPQEKEQKLLAKEQGQSSALDKYKQDEDSAESGDSFKQEQQNTVKDIEKNVPEGTFENQLVRRTKNAVDEESYLNMREWNFWHLALPFFILVIIFVVWARGKRKQ